MDGQDFEGQDAVAEVVEEPGWGARVWLPPILIAAALGLLAEGAVQFHVLDVEARMDVFGAAQDELDGFILGDPDRRRVGVWDGGEVQRLGGVARIVGAAGAAEEGE